MKYVEFCAGIGGTRAGFDVAGWECTLALDNNSDAVQVHQLAHGSAVERDVTLLSPEDVPEADIWVAGFPCQPFSSSGSRLGPEHKSGNVFEHIARLVQERQPSLLLLENVEGLLTNKTGHTFASILGSLTQLGYEVDWLVMDLRWYAVPQSRPRLFVIAARTGTLRAGALQEASGMLPGIGEAVPSVFRDYLSERKIGWSLRSKGKISDVVECMRPTIGKARHPGPQLFAGLGHASGDDYHSFNLSAPIVQPAPGSLASVVAPDFPNPEFIRSARYWSSKGGGGPNGLHVREEALSHCVGTSLGGAPLFAVPASTVNTTKRREAFLKFSNWHREQDGLLIMRLRPDRTALLFGPHTKNLSDAIGAWASGATRKYTLVGNMVAPVCAQQIATIVNSGLNWDSPSQAAGMKEEQAIGANKYNESRP